MRCAYASRVPSTEDRAPPRAFGPPCADVDLSRLPVMPALRTVSVRSEGRVTGIASLSRHPRLAGVGLAAEVDERESLALRGVPRLVDLRLGGSIPRLLSWLPRLRSAHVDARVENLRALARARTLKTLVVRGEVSDEALAVIGRMRSLRALGIGLRGFSDRGARAIRSLPLSTLVVYARESDVPTLGDDDLAEEAVPRRLRELPSLARADVPNAQLDIDPEIGARLERPWRALACRTPSAMCDPPEGNAD